MHVAANDYSPITIIRSQEQQFIPTPPTPPPTNVFSETPPQPQISSRIDNQFYSAQRFFTPNHHQYHDEPSPYVRAPNNPDTIYNNANDRAQYQRSYDAPSVGSGDFGVLRGGTFYPREETPYQNDEYGDYTDYYGETSSGNGRPAAAEFIQKYTYPEEQFEHFRDFADLNMEGLDGDFSQLSAVYTGGVSKNSTKSRENSHPRNIFEQLEMIDREKAQVQKKAATTTSKSKTKLAATKLEKSYKKQPEAKIMENEPLLALS